MDKREATPRPPCEKICGDKLDRDNCRSFRTCCAWRAWFAVELEKARANIRPRGKCTKTEELKVATDMKLGPLRFFGTETGAGFIYEPEEADK